MRNNRLFIFALFLIFGLYFVNPLLGLVNLPESFDKINSWILFIGGLLLLYSAFNSLRTRRLMY